MAVAFLVNLFPDNLTSKVPQLQEALRKNKINPEINTFAQGNKLVNQPASRGNRSYYKVNGVNLSRLNLSFTKYTSSSYLSSKISTAEIWRVIAARKRPILSNSILNQYPWDSSSLFLAMMAIRWIPRPFILCDDKIWRGPELYWIQEAMESFAFPHH